MKLKFKSLLLGIIVLITLISCSKDFLEKNPYGSVSQETLATQEGVTGLLTGVYALLKGGGESGGGYTSGWTSLLAQDDARQGSDSGVTELNAFLYSSSTSAFNNRWRFIYSAIQRTNDVLVMLPMVDDITADEALQIEAETKFLRGYFYLQLVTLWGNVPYIDQTVNYSEGNYLVANDTDVYPRIEEDFLFASEHLTETKAEVGRVNKWAAKSFLVKAYMFQQKFNEAHPLLEEIIANGQTSNGLRYALQPKYGDNFKTATRNSSETVFAVQMSVNDGANGANGNPMDSYNGTFGGPATCCYGWMAPSFDLVDAFQTDPVTGLPLIDTYYETPITNDQGVESTDPFTPYQATLDSRLDWSVGRRGIPYLDWGNHPGKAWVRNQYTSGPYSAIKNISTQANVETDRHGGGGGTNTPLNLLRFSDVLLWAAEVEVELGNLSGAEEYVNIVRERAANPAGFVYTYSDPQNPTAGFTDTPAANYKVGLYTGQFTNKGQDFARKAVRFERRLELALEHHRFLDMRRYDGNHFDQAKVHNDFMKREAVRPGFNEASLYNQGEYIRPQHDFFPIPQTQIDLSVNSDGSSVLIQNEGW